MFGRSVLRSPTLPTSSSARANDDLNEEGNAVAQRVAAIEGRRRSRSQGNGEGREDGPTLRRSPRILSRLNDDERGLHKSGSSRSLVVQPLSGEAGANITEDAHDGLTQEARLSL